LGLGRGLGLEDTLFFYAHEEHAQPSLRDIAKLIGKHLYNYEPHTMKPPLQV